MRRRSPPRLLAPLVVALVVALALGAAPPSVTDVRAATSDLTIVANARYDVQPERARVHVTVDFVATNHLRDTTTRRFYFDRAYLDVLPGTTAYTIDGGSGKPAVQVAQRRTGYTRLLISFGQRINSGKSASFRLQFELPDPGGSPTRNLRIGTSFVSFPVWAFAIDSTPGGTVSVVFPKGFNVSLDAGDLQGPRTEADGTIVYQSGKLSAPLRFYAFFVADRPGAYAETMRSATIGTGRAAIAVRAWPDDPDWAKRVGGLFERGLPAIAAATGLPWTRTSPLVVQEAVSRTTGGYAGLFDPKAGRVEVAYYADAFVILHEAAHAWFNGALLADRWANEGFASYYALDAAKRLGEKATAEPLTDALKKARVPLNAWGAVGKEPSATEDYGYAASVQLAQAIAQRAGADGLKSVWAAAAAGEAAYRPIEADTVGTGTHPVGPPEHAAAAPDWRGLLDLLEERTGKTYDDLWRTWVVRDGEATLLDERSAARREYLAVVAAARDWRLPAAVRDALRSWQFDDAVALLDEARGVLDERHRVEAAAAAAGLQLPSTMELAFEANGGFATASRAAQAELAAIDHVVAAETARIGNPDPVAALGLLGTSPDVQLAAAKSAFAAGDLKAAAETAVAASGVWAGAADVGRNRLLTLIGAAVLVLLALMFLVSRIRQRRRRQVAAAADAGGVLASADATAAGEAPSEPTPEAD